MYNRLKWSYEAEHLLKEIELNNDDIQMKVKRVVAKKSETNINSNGDSQDNYDLLIEQYHGAYIKHYTEYTAETDKCLMDARRSFLDELEEDKILYDYVSNYIAGISEVYSSSSQAKKRIVEAMKNKEQEVLFRLNVIVTYIRNETQKSC